MISNLSRHDIAAVSNERHDLDMSYRDASPETLDQRRNRSEEYIEDHECEVGDKDKVADAQESTPELVGTLNAIDDVDVAVQSLS